MAEVIFLVIVAICIVALFAIEGNRAKELNKLENRIEFLQDRLLELATRRCSGCFDKDKSQRSSKKTTEKLQTKKQGC